MLASISRVERGQTVHTRAATDDLARTVDRLQYEAGQGPCLDTLYEQVTVRLPDMGTERRWPDFTSRAVGLGVRSMLGIQLYVAGDELGALNLLSPERDAFGDESEHVGLLFASHAAVARAGAQQLEQLRQAVGTRDRIGQAKGILMERFKLTDDQAFRLLVQASQRCHRKLSEIADELVTSGQLAER